MVAGDTSLLCTVHTHNELIQIFKCFNVRFEIVPSKQALLKPYKNQSFTICRQKNQLHKPLIKFSSIQKGAVYSAINVFNKLPLYITQLQQNKVQFKNALQKYLLMHTFYMVEQFLLH
jgi:hypothetical protein